MRLVTRKLLFVSFPTLYVQLEGERLPAFAGGWLVPNGAGSLITAFHEDRECRLSPDARRMGYNARLAYRPDTDHHLMGFLMAAKRAARNIAQLPGNTPDLLETAMAKWKPLFTSTRKRLKTGVLASLLSCPEYEGLRDHGRRCRRH